MPDPYDVLTVAAVADELNATIGNGRIQRIGLLDPRTIGAELYAGGQRHYLIASAGDRAPRLRLAPEMPSLDTALVTPFGLLLRKHARGGIILGIDQPPLERLVRFSIAKRQEPLTTRASANAPGSSVFEGIEDTEDTEDFEPHNGENFRHVALYVELMGRHSNLILVDDDGRILESAKRVTHAMSRVRQVLPRLPYLPPPPPARLDPRRVTPVEMAHVLAAVAPEVDLARALVSAYRGISPQMGREIVYRATDHRDAGGGDVRPDAAGALAGAMLALLEPLRTTDWSPRIYRERGETDRTESESGAGDPVRSGGVARATRASPLQPPTSRSLQQRLASPLGNITAFSAVPMVHLAADFGEEAVDSVSAALALAEQARTGDRLGSVRHVQRRQRLLDAVTSARQKAERRLAALASESVRAGEAERLKTRGELIYGYLWQIAPGQRELIVDGETIALDPTLTASENAQSYFERYRKAQSAGTRLPGLADESRAEIAYLDQLATLIAQAPGFSELEALAAEWASLDEPEASSRSKHKSAPRRPRALVDAGGNSVYVGRSGPQNELVTFDIAGPDDTWLHTRGVGGSHVVIRWRTPDEPEQPETVEAAAALAAWYSAARESTGVEVDVARRRHVRKIKGARPGMVTYRNERTIRVQPAPEERLRDVLVER